MRDGCPSACKQKCTNGIVTTVEDINHHTHGLGIQVVAVIGFNHRNNAQYPGDQSHAHREEVSTSGLMKSSTITKVLHTCQSRVNFIYSSSDRNEYSRCSTCVQGPLPVHTHHPVLCEREQSLFIDIAVVNSLLSLKPPFPFCWCLWFLIQILLQLISFPIRPLH